MGACGVEWAVELVECGDLVQDADESGSQEEAERRWNRYVELVDAVTGAEGPAGAAALVASLRAAQDYGAYQATYAALQQFPPQVLGEGIAGAAQQLLTIPSDNAGIVLMLLAKTGEGAVSAFDAALAADVRERVRDLVAEHEAGEWLSEDRGVVTVSGGPA
ncbi:hypothetical protein LV79_003097 [Actinokineospora globicatena]|nr:hypothetical protein [Actinokineospora globicatena]GLW79474.1 hypothetical protein Aglo01_39560 [Actinokineospora globicatena]GLW86116.1 hypothetical protein Aglo02_37550 [Actinokineospora globicatena]